MQGFRADRTRTAERGTQDSNLESPVLETGAFQTRQSRVRRTQAGVERRRQDPQFKARVRHIIEEDRELLERLAR